MICKRKHRHRWFPIGLVGGDICFFSVFVLCSVAHIRFKNACIYSMFNRLEWVWVVRLPFSSWQHGVQMGSKVGQVFNLGCLREREKSGWWFHGTLKPATRLHCASATLSCRDLWQWSSTCFPCHRDSMGNFHQRRPCFCIPNADYSLSAQNALTPQYSVRTARLSQRKWTSSHQPTFFVRQISFKRK